MAVSRVFLDWRRPCLPAAAEWLLDRDTQAGLADLTGVVVALPGSRAGRRLLELLVATAEDREVELAPPKITTVGWLADLLVDSGLPTANETQRTLAWAQALRTERADALAPLLAAPPAPDDFAGWLALAETLARLHEELAGERLDFSGAAQAVERRGLPREVARWKLLARLQLAYLARLAEFGLADPFHALETALHQKRFAARTEVVLVAATEMHRLLRDLLAASGANVTALTFAPASMGDRFDSWGQVAPPAWLAAAVDVPIGRTEFVEGPGDQAAATVRQLGRWGDRFTTDRIVIGVPDVEVVPHVEQHCRAAGLATHYPQARPLTRHTSVRLLAAAADYLASPEGIAGRRYRDFATLLRHPEIERWLTARHAGDAEHVDWLTELDAYQQRHLPVTVGAEWLGPADDCRRLRMAFADVEVLLGSLAGGARPLRDWAEPIAGLLTAVFGAEPLDESSPEQHALLTACDALHDVLYEFASVALALAPRVSASEAIRWLLRRVDGVYLAPTQRYDAIELLGWLELALDDAPALAITGLNEGLVPSSVNADAFLPNWLRSELGLFDNDRRYARDAHAFGSILASKQELRIVAGRRTSDGGPLAPSRLLLACEPVEMARRLQKFQQRGTGGAAGLPRDAMPTAERKGQAPPGLQIPKPFALPAPIKSLGVTAFRDYLACPYRFYLRHVLKLRSSDDSARELDAGAFGNLVHAALEAFGQHETAHSTSPEEIGRFLESQLDAAVATDFGANPPAAVRVQVAQLRRRLLAFADWQSGWAAQGWRIQRTEAWLDKRQARLSVDGEPMPIRGRIDRIDRHEATGEWAIFDYKTSDSGAAPEATHRRSGEWIDLQLPLYRRLSEAECGPTPKLGYILLPKDPSKTGAAFVDWSAADLAEADAVADDVVRGVRQAKFWPPADPPPAFFDEYAAICQDDQYAHVALEDDDR